VRVHLHAGRSPFGEQVADEDKASQLEKEIVDPLSEQDRPVVTGGDVHQAASSIHL
jgi:hypothetical protein